MTEKDLVIKDLQQKLNTCNQAYQKLDKIIKEELNNTLSSKIKTRCDKFWSVIAVFLTPGHTETTLPKRLGMFFKTMWAWARNGFKLEEEQVATARFEMCKVCPYLKKENTQCILCGCLMDKKTKISGASCPLKKW